MNDLSYESYFMSLMFQNEVSTQEICCVILVTFYYYATIYNVYIYATRTILELYALLTPLKTMTFSRNIELNGQ